MQGLKNKDRLKKLSFLPVPVHKKNPKSFCSESDWFKKDKKHSTVRHFLHPHEN
jgi:hypothetical protein